MSVALVSMWLAVVVPCGVALLLASVIYAIIEDANGTSEESDR